MKCSFSRLLYPKRLEEARDGSYMIALFKPNEKVLDAQGNRLSSIKVVGHFLPTVASVKVDMTGHWKKDARYEDIEALRQLELAYATTIHKSQGSEYDAVLINIQDMHGKMLNRALFYTAETRAKKRVIIVGDWDAVVRAIQTADTKRRHTMLAMRINELTKE